MRTTDIDRQAAMVSAVTELYRHAVHFKLGSKEVADELIKVIARKEYQRLPEYRRHAVMTLHRFLFHGPADLSIYQHLEYRMLGPDGKYYASFDTWRALFPDGDASLIQSGHHFWKGTDKIFF